MRRYRMKVTIKTFDGTIIERPIELTSQRATDAVYRARLVAPKPGQRVLAVAVEGVKP